MPIVLDDVGPVGRKLVPEKDVGQTKIENQNAKVEKLAEHKICKVTIGFVSEDVEVLDVLLDHHLHVGLVDLDEGGLGLLAEVSDGSAFHQLPELSRNNEENGVQHQDENHPLVVGGGFVSAFQFILICVTSKIFLKLFAYVVGPVKPTILIDKIGRNLLNNMR